MRDGERFIFEATVEGLFTLGPPGWSRDERSPGARILNFLQLEKERMRWRRRKWGLIDRGANHKC